MKACAVSPNATKRRLLAPKSKTTAIIAAVVVLALALGWRLGSRQSLVPSTEANAAEASQVPQTTAVTTLIAASQPVDDYAEMTGSVVAVQRAELAAKVTGRVSRVFVREGEHVVKGQLLVQLEAADLEAAAAQAAASTGAAAAALAQAQTAAELQKEQSRAAVKEATENLRTAQAKLSTVVEGARTQEKATADQQVVQAEAEARNAKANYDRYQRLYAQGAVSAVDRDSMRLQSEVAQSRLETARQQASLTHEGSRRQDIAAAQAQVAAAREALRLARASVAENQIKADQARMARAELGQARAATQAADVQYGYSRIVAPFSGVVVSRLVDPGTLAGPGKILVVVEDDSLYRLEAQVPEEALGRLHIGEEVPVRVDAVDRTLTGRLSRIIPSADPSSHTVTVKIDLPRTNGVRSGLFGRMQLADGSRPALELPDNAIVQRGQLSEVFVVDGGRATMRLVTLGERRGGRTEILSGLQPGDRVITSRVDQLRDGQLVRDAR